MRRALAPALAGCSALLCASCLSLEFFGGLPRPLVETVVYGETGPKILMLEIDGVITRKTPEREIVGPVRDNPVSRIREQLDRAREDREVRALLLRIDSPGGSATASDMVYHEILRFKRERGLPVVAQLMGTAASGGYYVAMAADAIVAHPTSVTGSIGVLFLGVNFVGLMDKLGIENQTLVAGRHKDAGSPLRRLTPEERAHLQSVLDDLHARFKRVVVAGRPGLDAAQIEALADGSIFSAVQALDRGLVDEIGDLEKSVAMVQQIAGIASSRVVVYHRPREYENNLWTGVPSLRLELPFRIPELSRPGFYYLWAPGLR